MYRVNSVLCRMNQERRSGHTAFFSSGIDLYIGEYRSRSEFIETAARKFIAQLARKEAERRDLELINRHSDSLNAEAEDVLTYQVPL